MALSSLGLGFIFSAKDLASRSLQRLTVNFTRMDRAATKSTKSFNIAVTGLVVGALAAAAGIVALNAAVGAANFSGQFTLQLAAAQQIMRATTEEVAALRAEVIKTGIETKFSPDELVEGIKNLGAAGQTASEAIATLRPAALLATAGQISLDESSRAVVGTLKAFTLEADQAVIVTDKLTRATQISNFQAADFEVGLSRVAGVAGVFKQSLDEVLVGMGALRNMNIEASVASTSLREAIRRVSSDANVQKKILKAGVEIYDKSTGAIRDLGAIMFDLDDKLQGVTKSQRDQTLTQIFGARGILAFGAATNLTVKAMRDGIEVTLRGAEAWAHLREEIANAEGTTEQFNAALLNTFKGQQQLMDGILKTMRTVFGEAFEAVLLPILKVINQGLTKFVAFIEKIPKPMKETAAMVFLAVSAFVTFAGIAVATVAAMVLLKFAVVALASPLLIVLGTLTLLTGGMLLLGGAIAAVAFGAKKNFGGIADSVQEMWKKASLFLTALKEDLFEGGIRGDTLAALMDKENKGLLRKLGRTKQLIFRVQKFFKGMFEGVEKTLSENQHVFEALTLAFKDFTDALGIGAEEMGLLTTESDKSRQSGQKWGETLGLAVLILVKGLTLGIILMKEMVDAGKKVADNWNRLIGIVKVLVLTIIVLRLSVLAYRGALILVTAAQLAWKVMMWLTVAAANGNLIAQLRLQGALLITMARTALASGAMGLFATATAGASLALLGPAALVVAVGAAAVAIGIFLDNTFGLSDGLANLLLDVTGVTDELAKLDDAYTKDATSRGLRAGEIVKVTASPEARAAAREIVARENAGQPVGSAAIIDSGSQTQAARTAREQGGAFRAQSNDQIQVTQELLELLRGSEEGRVASTTTVNFNVDEETLQSIIVRLNSSQETGSAGSFSEP